MSRRRSEVYWRASGSGPVLVLLNYRSTPMTVRLDPPAPLSQILSSGPLRDLLNDEALPVDSAAPMIELRAFGARILLGAPPS